MFCHHVAPLQSHQHSGNLVAFFYKKKMAASMKSLFSPRSALKIGNLSAVFIVKIRSIGSEQGDPSYKFKSEFFNRHSLASIAAKRRMLGLDANPPDTFVPSVSDVEESSAEWQFVERLIPMATVPTPPEQPYPTPSGWSPPSDTPPDLPYFVHRNRFHLFNVFFKVNKDLSKKYTTVKRIEGDIMLMESDLRRYLEDRNGNGKQIISYVNEAAGIIRFRGRDYTQEIVEWLMRVGF